ncbi:MAG: hypothetical protein Q7K43_01125 [Candidatus Woesearchaeota archaeon]|nr:hypothetical protein [Candidatus Woesearchaeota archaeon]
MTKSDKILRREKNLLEVVQYLKRVQEKVGLEQSVRLFYALSEAAQHLPSRPLEQLAAYVTNRLIDKIAFEEIELLPLAFARAIQERPTEKELILGKISSLYSSDLANKPVTAIAQQLTLPCPTIPVLTEEECQERIAAKTGITISSLFRGNNTLEYAVKQGLIQSLNNKEGLDYLEGLEKAGFLFSLEHSFRADPDLYSRISTRFVA